MVCSFLLLLSFFVFVCLFVVLFFDFLFLVLVLVLLFVFFFLFLFFFLSFFFFFFFFFGGGARKQQSHLHDVKNDENSRCRVSSSLAFCFPGFDQKKTGAIIKEYNWQRWNQIVDESRGFRQGGSAPVL